MSAPSERVERLIGALAFLRGYGYTATELPDGRYQLRTDDPKGLRDKYKPRIVIFIAESFGWDGGQ